MDRRIRAASTFRHTGGGWGPLPDCWSEIGTGETLMRAPFFRPTDVAVDSRGSRVTDRKLSYVQFLAVCPSGRSCLPPGGPRET